MNSFSGTGRITKDPELQKTQSGISKVKFTLAVNRRFAKEGEQQADFIQCVCWRQSADYMANYVKKGALLGVEGSLRVDNFQDKDGKTVYCTYVLCENVNQLAQASSSHSHANATQSSANTYTQPPITSQIDIANYIGIDDVVDISGEDLPF